MDDSLISLLMESQHKFTYDGIGCVKNPFDFGIMTVLLKKEQPRTIIEVGSYNGGSARWMHDLTKSYGLDCHIYSVDVITPIERKVLTGVGQIIHPIPGVAFLKGDGRLLHMVFDDDFMENCQRPLLMIDDADHFEETTSSILNFFAKWSKPNEMIVGEDGVVPEVLAAIRKFLSKENKFEVDRAYCDFWGSGLTFFPNGYIRRVG